MKRFVEHYYNLTYSNISNIVIHNLVNNLSILQKNDCMQFLTQVYESDLTAFLCLSCLWYLVRLWHCDDH